MTAAGMTPDPWQARLLRSDARQQILLCSRQAGKTTLGAALAVLTLAREAPALVLIVSPSERQSGEDVSRVKEMYDALSRPRDLAGPTLPWYEAMVRQAGRDESWLSLPGKVRESALQLHLSNGSRVIGLPSSEATVRGYSAVSLLILDEAARIPDNLYRTVRPMLATSGGRLVTMSTPFGQRGWFYDEWTNGRDWERVRVPALMCPRIDAAFLASERAALGSRWFSQEYGCSFESVEGAVFDPAAVDAAFRPLGGQSFGDPFA
jgi:hypothetical protein